MAKLTQAIFKGAPNWVKSAAVNSNGRAYFYPVEKSELTFSQGFWFMNYGAYSPLAGIDFDGIDCKNSAIDREVDQ